MNITDSVRTLTSLIRGRHPIRPSGTSGVGRTRSLDDALYHTFGSAAAGWAQPVFGEYYPRSAIVYAAIKVRQDAIARVPLRVLRRVPSQCRRTDEGVSVAFSGVSARASGEPVGANHPLQRLLDSPNPFWSRGDLWRATETYLSL